MERFAANVHGLALTGEAQKEALVVRLVGELDLAGASAMQEMRHWVDAQPDHAPLVLDLSALSFVDSSGLRMLLETTAGNRPVALFSPSVPVARVLELTGLRDRFTEIVTLESHTLRNLRSDGRP